MPLMDKSMGRSSRCPDARVLLPAYVEGELDAAELSRVTGHLESCSECRAEEAQYRQVLGALGASREPLRPGDLYTGFAAKLERYERRTLLRQRQLRWASGFACLLLVVSAGASWMAGGWRGQSQQNAPDTPPSRLAKAQPPPGGGKATRNEHPGNVVGVPKEQPNTGADQIHPNQTDPFSNDRIEIVRAPEEDRSEPRGRRPVRPHRRPKVEMAHNFLDVTPEQGKDARHLLDDAARAGGADLGGGHKIVEVQPVDGAAVARADRHPNVPGMAYYETEAEQRLRIGDTITRVSRARGYNNRGDLVLVKVNIGTASKTETDADTSTKFSGEERP